MTGSRRLLRHGDVQSWRCEDGMLVEEGVCLRGHWLSRMSVEVRRCRRGVPRVVREMHEGLAERRQGVKAGLQ